MAESMSDQQSLYLSSDNVPEHYCDPCSDVYDKIKPVAGYCQNCNEELCLECFTGHLRRKQFQNHKLVDKSTRPKTTSALQTNSQSTGEECHLHHGESIQSFCHDHSQLCCKVCITINHLSCKTEEITELAKHIKDSQELQSNINRLKTLQNRFKDSLGKTGTNESVIQRNYSNAIHEMMKFREEFDQLMTETQFQADKVKEEDFNKIEKVATTCAIVIPQIKELTTNLETLKEKGEMERLFVSMKHAEGQLKSLKENLEKIDQENIVREYQFEPDARMKALFNELKQLGQLLFEKSGTLQKKKRPIHFKDIIVKSLSEKNCTIYDSLVLPNKQMLITDYQNSKLKLIDTNQNKIISELILYGQPVGITKVKDNEIAVTIPGSTNKVKFVTLSQNSLSIGRAISVNGYCWGIAYNDKDQTLIVTYFSPSKIEILNMTGTLIKCLDRDSKGVQLFDNPRHVALSPNKTEMYVTDYGKDSVMRLTMSGDVMAEYMDRRIQRPEGICVHKSGIVYVIGTDSHTVHQLDPDSGAFKLQLGQKDRLYRPLSINYCELEDKLFIGIEGNSCLKVFQMK